jgi:hypothetical protein
MARAVMSNSAASSVMVWVRGCPVREAEAIWGVGAVGLLGREP